jgi:hypothetical protein
MGKGSAPFKNDESRPGNPIRNGSCFCQTENKNALVAAFML